MIRPKDREIAETLRLIVQRHGREMIDEIPRFCALMNDYIMTPELKPEKALLYRACTSGVMSAIAAATPDQMEIACKQGYYHLTANEFIADEWAKRVISWIDFALREEEPAAVEDGEMPVAPVVPVAVGDGQSAMERLLDPSNDECVVLLNGSGEETEFDKIAVIEHDGHVYFLLRPLEEVPGVGADEAMLFVLREEQREEFLSLVAEESVMDIVFEKYKEQCE